MTSYIPASYTAPGGGDSPVFRPEIIQHNRRHASEKKDMLRCFICQGNGSSEMKFSDVSHLITHVNSKGHLISKNNLEILALGVPQAQETLDDFMAWEERHGIKKLSFDRITNKAQGDQAEQDERKDKHTREPQEERGRTKSRGGHASARGKMRGGRRGSTRGRGGQRAHVSKAFVLGWPENSASIQPITPISLPDALFDAYQLPLPLPFSLFFLVIPFILLLRQEHG